MLEGERGHQAKEIDKLVAWLREEPPFDVIVLPNALLISLAGPLARSTGRPVLCTLQGEDLFLEGLEAETRRRALSLIRQHAAHVTRFVAVSDYYAAFMADYLGLSSARIDVVPIGISLDGYAPRTRTGGHPFTVGYFARIDPAKGLDRLCAVYRHMRRELGLPPSRLVAAGYLGHEHRPYLDACTQRMRDWELGAEFDYVGEVDRAQKIAFLRGLDVLSVPTPYAEPKGLFLLEAMACGVPVVQPRRGAYPEILDRTGGGLLVDDHEEAIADGLMRVWRDPALAAVLGQQAAAGVRSAYGAGVMADRALDVYRGAAAEGAARIPTAASA
jgi:glycosyltransferase involved in cell wall biosynthesis